MGSYIYIFTSVDSRLAMMKIGWKFQRDIPLKFHLAPWVLRKDRNSEPIPAEYANWRFAQHPKKQYYLYRKYGLTFLIDNRREHIYAVGGVINGLSGGFLRFT